jgi:hypothetical protein
MFSNIKSRVPGVRTMLGVALLLSAPSYAHADAGLVMLPVAFPVLLIYLVPVVVIESLYLHFRLQTPIWETLKAVGAANLATTFLGFPLTWLLFLILDVGIAFGLEGLHVSIPQSPFLNFIGVLLSAPWIAPMEGEHWPILVAFVGLLIPSFFVSAWVESILLNRRGWLCSEQDSSRAVWQANMLSYVFLALSGCLLLWHWINTR